ncbi:MAG: hypothetical protein L6R45_05490 [Anaerolineae bacterium]|nr:hypothetical protein [Anaerolineae bacterium]
MEQLKLMLKGALVTLIFCLAVTLTALVVSELQTVRADVARPVTTDETVEYAPLHDAPLQRDVTAQRFAPLEVE